MWWLLAAGLAFGAEAWKDGPSDVSVERVISADASAIYPHLTDMRVLEAFFGAECVTRWAHGSESKGPNARAEVKYRLKLFSRKSTLTFSKLDTERFVELGYAGKKGFFTQFELEPADGGTRVTLTTYVSPPKWPFLRYFVFQVRPTWEACYEQTMDALQARVAGGS